MSNKSAMSKMLEHKAFGQAIFKLNPINGYSSVSMTAHFGLVSFACKIERLVLTDLPQAPGH